MPKPDKLMELMSKSPDSGVEESVALDAPGPIGAPMTTPQPNEGAQAEAQAKIALGLKLLSQALLPYGSESKEGAAVMDAITKLTKTFGIKLDEGEKMIPAELKMLVEAAGMKSPEMMGAQAAPPMPGAPPMLQAA